MKSHKCRFCCKTILGLRVRNYNSKLDPSTQSWLVPYCNIADRFTSINSSPRTLRKTIDSRGEAGSVLRSTRCMGFRVWSWRHVTLRPTETVGQVIDASCPQLDEVRACYLLHLSEGLLPLRHKISPNALPAPLLPLQYALVGRTHGLPRGALGVCVVFDRALDTLLMHHVSLGVIGIVT